MIVTDMHYITCNRECQYICEHFICFSTNVCFCKKRAVIVMHIESFCEETFSKRLKEIRKKSGLSQEKLAKELEISKSALSYYENGERIPDIVFLDKVCIYYNVSLDYLMGYSDAMNPEKASIVDRTGLSEEAVNILIEEFDNDNDYLSNILDKLIKSKDFREALRILETACHLDRTHREESPLFPFSYAPSYMVFLIEKLMMSAIKNVIDERNSDIGAAIYNTLLSTLSAQEQQQFIQWSLEKAEKLIKEFDEARETTHLKNIQEWEEYLKEEEATRTEAIQKLHGEKKQKSKEDKDGDLNAQHNQK